MLNFLLANSQLFPKKMKKKRVCVHAKNTLVFVNL